MGIHILSTNPKTNSQLEALLQDLGHNCKFYESLDAINPVLRRLKKTDSVFYDLQLENKLWAFEHLYVGCRKTNLVAFEPMTKQTSAENNHCPEGLEYYLLLSPDNARAKIRIQAILHAIESKPTKKKARRKAKTKTRKTVSESSKPTDLPEVDPALQCLVQPLQTRYLQAYSPAMRAFIPSIQAAISKRSSIMVLEGEDGAEFEMVAREINYQANGDKNPLILLDLTQMTFDELDRNPERPSDFDQPRFCYIGLSYELNATASENLLLLLQHLEESQLNDANSNNLHLIIGHVDNSESYLSSTIKPTLRKMRKGASILKIPDMAERLEDIPTIAHSIFSMLRMAHPFLIARTLSHTAIEFLEENCASLDYCTITRLMRNTMSLSKSDILTDEHLKSFSDNSPTSQHLVESLADEAFFSEEVV